MERGTSGQSYRQSQSIGFELDLPPPTMSAGDAPAATPQEGSKMGRAVDRRALLARLTLRSGQPKQSYLAKEFFAAYDAFGPDLPSKDHGEWANETVLVDELPGRW